MSQLELPSSYGRDTLSWIVSRANAVVGQKIQKYGATIWPGVPFEALVGFTSIAPGSSGQYADTALPPPEGVSNSFHEIGFFQTEAGPRDGPAPNPDPHADYNRWGLLHGDPLVIAALGRPAVMDEGAWRDSIDDQVVVGLVNLRRYAEEVAAQLPTGLAPSNYATPYAVALGFTAFSAGASQAVRVFSRDERVGKVPDLYRWPAVVFSLTSAFSRGETIPGPAGRHGNPAYDLLRTWQKFAAGRALAGALGRSQSWFDSGFTDEAQQEAAILAAAQHGAPPSGPLSAPAVTSWSQPVVGVILTGGSLALQFNDFLVRVLKGLRR